MSEFTLTMLIGLFIGFQSLRLIMLLFEPLTKREKATVVVVSLIGFVATILFIYHALKTL